MSVGDDDKTVIQTQGLVTMHGPWYQGCLLHLSPHHPIPYQCRSGSFGWNGIAQFPNAYSCHRKPQKDRRTVSGCSDDVFVSSSCSFWVVLCYFVYLNMSIYIYICFISHTLGGPVADHRGTSSVCSSLAERASVASQLKTSRFSNGSWL